MANASPLLSGPAIGDNTEEVKPPEIAKPVLEVVRAEDFFLSSSKSLLGKRAAHLNPEIQFEPRSSSENDIPDDEKTTLSETQFMLCK